MKRGQEITVVEGESSFFIILPRETFGKGDIINIDRSGAEYVVHKVYKLTWWKKLLLKMGKNVKMMMIKRII